MPPEPVECRRDAAFSDLGDQYIKNIPEQIPGPQRWWSEWGMDFPQELRHYIDGLIRAGEAAE